MLLFCIISQVKINFMPIRCNESGVSNDKFQEKEMDLHLLNINVLFKKYSEKKQCFFYQFRFLSPQFYCNGIFSKFGGQLVIIYIGDSFGNGRFKKKKNLIFFFYCRLLLTKFFNLNNLLF